MPLDNSQTYTPLPGDVLACWGGSLTAQTIQYGTSGGPSHVALVVPNLNAKLNIVAPDEPQVLESTSLSNLPCLYRGRIVSGLQLHDWSSWLATERIVYAVPLRPLYGFNADEIEDLARVASGMLREGAPYDYRGAVKSWTTILKRLAGARIDEQFCSENVSLLLSFYRRFPLGNPAWNTPAAALKTVDEVAYFSARRRLK